MFKELFHIYGLHFSDAFVIISNIDELIEIDKEYPSGDKLEQLRFVARNILKKGDLKTCDERFFNCE